MNKKLYIETYGCQMNLADTEIVSALLFESNFELTNHPEEANLILINTCSVRERAEQRIYGRLGFIKKIKEKNKNLIVGIIGCMAERLKEKIITDYPIVDLIIGPDEYRNVTKYLEQVESGEKAVGVELSLSETYEDIEQFHSNGLSAWLPIMRGCNNFCSYCIVPYTRGRERSRSFNSILNEVEKLSNQNYKEITLLGQNVNSYFWNGKDFSDLIETCAKVNRNIRIRFITSHPKDLSEKLLHCIADNENICNHLHLPLQSGSSRILELMNRKYTYEHYYDLIQKARVIIPGISITTDIIAGFPSESEEDHKATMNAIEQIKYDNAFMFKYSPREGTLAYKLEDDVADRVKIFRLSEIINLQQNISKEINDTTVGKIQLVLIEGKNKKNPEQMIGRTDNNKFVVVENNEIKIGDIVRVKIINSTSATLFAKVLT